MDEFKDSVKKGFSACKSDIEALNIENKFLKDKLNTLENQNSNLQNQVNDLTTEVKGVKIALDFIKSFTENLKQTQEPANPIVVEQPVPQVQQQTNNIIPKIQTKDPYEALLAFKAKANKREMLKQKLLSMIGDHGMNLSELKFMFVEHFRYTSKATFYNYLKELELEKSVHIERENGKNFIYLKHLSKTI